MEVLRIENLSKFYTSETSVVVGLTGINLSFSTGEFIALTGESGSGKSTLAHVLGGILPYESGELYIYGRPTSHFDAYDWSKYRRDLISFISQSYGILPGNTVSENIESALLFSGLTADEARARTVEILKEVELTEFAKRKAGKLSSGQKQRLSIARALAKPSKILIADEPTGNLDRENSEKVISLLKRASKDRLVILITHEFEEAKDAATRRIILSDGAVVTDAKLADVPEAEESAPSPEPEQGKKRKKPLAPYVCRLTLRSRPVFTAILCLLLAVTMFITFVFAGNFIISLDDSPTRIYDPRAFTNGDSRRLTVMRADGAELTQEDYQKILSAKYVESIDRFGYVNDFVCHYKEGTDHRFIQTVVVGPNYHEVLNPGDYTIESKVQLFDTGYSFIRTLPYTDDNIIVEGRAPEGTYEVVSADPDIKLGDTVTVYIRNISQWAIGSYFEMKVKVVGTSEHGEGIYFSDDIASMLVYSIIPMSSYAPYHAWPERYVFAPYDPDIFPLSGGIPEGFVLEDNEYIFSENKGNTNVDIGTKISVLPKSGERLLLTCRAIHKASYSKVIFISEKTFDDISIKTSNQISVYIKDYAYAQRVTDALTEMDYITISPYKLGATEIDPELANERLISLAVCAATLIISFLLQWILLRAMFSSLFEYYRLMSNTGLTWRITSGALTLMVLMLTLISEAAGGSVIALLNGAGVERIVNIFKYLDTTILAALVAIHFATILFSLSGILSNLKKNVFGKGKSTYDIDFTLMEDGDL